MAAARVPDRAPRHPRRPRTVGARSCHPRRRAYLGRHRPAGRTGDGRRTGLGLARVPAAGRAQEQPVPPRGDRGRRRRRSRGGGALRQRGLLAGACRPVRSVRPRPLARPGAAGGAAHRLDQRRHRDGAAEDPFRRRRPGRGGRPGRAMRAAFRRAGRGAAVGTRRRAHRAAPRRGLSCDGGWGRVARSPAQAEGRRVRLQAAGDDGARGRGRRAARVAHRHCRRRGVGHAPGHSLRGARLGRIPALRFLQRRDGRRGVRAAAGGVALRLHPATSGRTG
jgi:hypothetical protein